LGFTDLCSEVRIEKLSNNFSTPESQRKFLPVLIYVDLM